jgi:hypothetical protein
MLKQLRIEMNRSGQMKRRSGKPLPHSLNSDPHATGFACLATMKQLEQFGVVIHSPPASTT